MNPATLFLCAAAVSTLFASPEAPAPVKTDQAQVKPDGISYSDAEKVKFMRGEIVIKEVPNPAGHEKGKTYEALGLIKGTMEQVFGVLADYANYPKFMPNVESTRIESSEGSTAVVEYKLGLPMGQVKRYKLSLSAAKEDAEAYISWSKVPWPELKDAETIVETTGFWLLKPFPEKPGWVLARYNVYTDPGHIPTGFGWIVNILTKSSMPYVVKNTNKRVASLYYK